ncbi:hypothetical protein F5146DRAFT_997857 [Armillaria mellea]|nr:hypothetical protein F5146DRAFT_997857 [Armillaria mellea]
MSGPKSRTGEQQKDLMKLIISNGDHCPQLAAKHPNLFIVYGGTITPYDLKLLIDKGIHDVVKPEWSFAMNGMKSIVRQSGANAAVDTNPGCTNSIPWTSIVMNNSAEEASGWQLLRLSLQQSALDCRCSSTCSFDVSEEDVALDKRTAALEINVIQKRCCDVTLLAIPSLFIITERCSQLLLPLIGHTQKSLSLSAATTSDVQPTTGLGLTSSLCGYMVALLSLTKTSGTVNWVYAAYDLEPTFSWISSRDAWAYEGRTFAMVVEVPESNFVDAVLPSDMSRSRQVALPRRVALLWSPAVP